MNSRIMGLNKIFFPFLFLTFVLPGAFSQTFHFREFGTEKGLDRYVYSINQDLDGYLWLATGGGLSRFDGISFRNDLIPDSLRESYFTTGFRDSRGHLWFGTNTEGVLLYYNGDEMEVLDVGDYTSNKITGIIEAVDGSVIVATQNEGLLKIDKKGPNRITHFSSDFGIVYSLGKTPDNKLLIGTNEGLFLYSMPQGHQPPVLINKIEGFPSITVRSIYLSKTSGSVFIGTRRGGVYILQKPEGNDACTIQPLFSDQDLLNLDVLSVIEDSDRNLWMSTNSRGLFKIQFPFYNVPEVSYVRYHEGNGLGSDRTLCVFQDFEENVWVGTNGQGLAMLLDEAFTFISFEESGFGNSISAISGDGRFYYLAGEKGILSVDKENGATIRLFSTGDGLPDGAINALHYIDDGRLFIGTENNGLYVLNTGTGRIKPFYSSSTDRLERQINFITNDDDRLWVATNQGILLFDLSTGAKVKTFSTREGLPHNSIEHLYLDEKRQLWLSTRSDVLYYLTSDLQVKAADFASMGQSIDFRSALKTDKGDLWAATYGSGVLQFTEDTVYQFTGQTGLKTIYCYGIFKDGLNRLWVGHRQGFSRIYEDEAIIKQYGPDYGITGDANQNSGFLDADGKLLLGTSEGVMVYDYNNDKDVLAPPKVNISSLVFNDEVVPFSEHIVMPYNDYKVRIYFVGISFRDPGKVLYQYRMENYDPEWSDLSPLGYADFPRFEDGRYTFQLRAYNADFQTTEEPVSLTIMIKKPFWKTWWFVSAIFAAVIMAVIIIIKVRERNHKRLQAYLQKELTQRTREVVEQKEEIELKNKEITDSINYAQRIQASILPPVRKLKDNFKGSFIFYQPRDIVSGDFYWWDRVNDDRFIIVCADSTGHGVPGAFMSMIGSTLIKDIVSRNVNIKPSELLETLDHEITNSLNQNIEVHASNDGMDIIVCEFNLKTRHLRFASAMRPIIMYHRGEQYYIRGNRSSVGGEAIEGKMFEDQEYQLVPGDVVYLFSDGYPDQFGGPLGKKLKMVRLKNLLDDIHERGMDDQFNHIRKNFETWKKGYDQVDDVLFMGLQV